MSAVLALSNSLTGRQVYFEQRGVTIYCGNNEEVRDQILSIDNALIYADPPYGVNERTARASNGRGNLAICNDFDPVEGDAEEFDPTPWLAAKRLILWGANHYSRRLPNSSSWLVWDKRDGMSSNDNADGEMAWTNLGGPMRLFHHTWNGMIRASERTDPRTHPTQKPVALASWAIQKFAGIHTVIDPFMGSGSAILAAMDLGLNAIGIETNEKYCEAVKQRIVARSLDLFRARKATKRCSACERLLQVEIGKTFNKHSAQQDGLQPFCRECDCKQKNEPEKAWKRFSKEMDNRGKGESKHWDASKYYKTLGDRICVYCGCDVTEWSGGYWIDKIDPAGRYEPNNCVPCCWPCNATKSNKSPEAWHHELQAVLSRYPRGKVPHNLLNPKFERISRRVPDLSAYVVGESLAQTVLKWERKC